MRRVQLRVRRPNAHKTMSSTAAALATPAALNVRDSRLAFAGIIGDPSLKGQPASVGTLLKVIDGFAACVAENAIPRTTVMGGGELQMNGRVAHGDLVRYEGQVLSTGRSSIAVQVTGYRHDLRERSFVQVLNSIMTLVAVDGDRVPSAELPKLVDSENPEYSRQIEQWAADRKAFMSRWSAAQQAVDQLPRVTKSMLADSSDSPKSSGISVAESRIEIGTVFMPRDMNELGTAYGGYVLNWMDDSALYCAKNFTQNENVITVGMSRMSFILPVTVQDMVACNTSVTRVSGSRLEVAVEIYLQKIGSVELKKSHTAYFTIANLDENGQEIPITQQLAVDESDQDSLRAMLKAQCRAELAPVEHALLTFNPLELSLSTKPHQPSKL